LDGSEATTKVKTQALDISEIEAACKKQLEQASGSFYSSISQTRAKLDERFHGRPYGDENPDRSQVVSTDIADTISWIIPALIKIYAGSENAIRFEPQGADDEEAAMQETDVASYVFYRQNNGFHLLYEAFHDALVKKNCIVKTWWEEKEETRIEEYSGIEYEELIKTLKDLGADLDALIDVLDEPDDSSVIDIPVSEESNVVSVEFLEYDMGEEEREIEGLDPTTGQPIQVVEVFETFDIKMRIKEQTGKVRITTLAPENFLISPRWDSIFLGDCPFTAHRELMTKSELIQLGYDRDQVEQLPKGDEFQFGEERNERFEREESGNHRPFFDDERGVEQVIVAECYIKLDADGDGVAELLKVTTAGPQGEVLYWQDTGEPDIEEVSRNPFQAGTPLLEPHKFFGQSIAEIVQDIQRIKTMLQRQMLDNLYLCNNMRPELSEDGNGPHTMKDLLNWKPGAPIRTKRPGNLAFHAPPPMWQNTLTPIEYMDSVRENRTGITRYSQGLDGDTLNKTASGIMQIMDASRDKIELIARSFGEFLIKQIFREIRELLREHSSKAMTIRIRGKWVDADPRRWRNREDMTVNVGLGSGNRDVQIGHLGNLLNIQERLGQVNPEMVRPIHTWAVLEKMVGAMGLKSPERFFEEPDPEAQWPDRGASANAENQAKMQLEQGKLDLEKQKISVQMSQAEFDAWEKMQKLEIQRDSVESAAMLKASQIEAQTGLDDHKVVQSILAHNKTQLDREKAEQQAVQAEQAQLLQAQQQRVAEQQASQQAAQGPQTGQGGA